MSTTPARVLFLIPSLQGGGAERVVVSLLRHLDRSRFALSLAVVDMRDAVYRHDVPDDVDLIDLACTRVRYALPKIVKLVRSMRPATVFTTLGHLNLGLAIMRPLLPDGVHYVARETSIVSELMKIYRAPRLWTFAYRRFYRRFDRVVCQSTWMRDDLVDAFGFPTERALVIHNPVDIARVGILMQSPLPDDAFGSNNVPGEIRLVAAGRLSAEKGFDLLIEAIALCANPRLRLVILGQGPLKDALDRLVADRGLRAQIRFAGFCDNPYPYLAGADAFILSSRFEGFPNVVLEALACGTPVIATPAPGGTTEILSGMSGCALAESVSAQALADTIGRFEFGCTIDPAVLEPYAVEKVVRRYEAALA